MLLNTFLFIFFFPSSPLWLLGRNHKRRLCCVLVCVCVACVSVFVVIGENRWYSDFIGFFFIIIIVFVLQNKTFWGGHFCKYFIFFGDESDFGKGSSVYSYIYIIYLCSSREMTCKKKNTKHKKKGIPVSHPCWPPVGPQVAPHVAVLCRVLDFWGDTSSGKLRCWGGVCDEYDEWDPIFPCDLFYPACIAWVGGALWAKNLDVLRRKC